MSRSNTSFSASVSSGAKEVTPHDTEIASTVVFRALYIGVSGDVAVETADGDSVIFKNAGAGSILPVRVLKVKATGTTATDIIGLY